MISVLRIFCLGIVGLSISCDDFSTAVQNEVKSEYEILYNEAMKGNAQDQFKLALAYQEGRVVAKSDSAAAVWFRLSAAQGYSDAQVSLALMYPASIKGGKDLFDLLSEAAELGNTTAQLFMIRKYVDEDKEVARRWVGRLYDHSDIDTEYAEILYQAGKWFGKDTSEANKLFRKAAVLFKENTDKGDADAPNMLGWMYDEGLSFIGEEIPQNGSEALKMHLLAATRGSIPAYARLGAVYSVDPYEDMLSDYKEAFKWKLKAAEAGDANSQYLVGEMYYNGTGIPQNHTEAVFWYSLAAEQGDMLSISTLAWMYEKGKGVPQDFVAAHMYWNIAGSLSDYFDRQRKNRDDLAEKMTASQIAEAQLRASEWKPKSWFELMGKLQEER